MSTGKDADWQRCQLAKMPTDKDANWQRCQLAKMPTGKDVNWQSCFIDAALRKEIEKEKRKSLLINN